LKWVDQQDKEKTDGVVSGNAPGEKPTVPLAKLVPIRETLDFKNKITAHHAKTQRDVQSCLKGTKLNKLQK